MTEKLYKKCACDWRPKCERYGPCGEYAVVSEWMPDRKNGGRYSPVWLCEGCLATWSGRQVKLKGIDRPDNADEYWRPSIIEHARHGIIALAFEDSREAARPVSTGRRYSWERRLTPAQWDNYQVLRRAMVAHG